jgi:hypothetical protein
VRVSLRDLWIIRRNLVNKAIAEIGKHRGVGQKMDITTDGLPIGSEPTVIITMPDNGRTKRNSEGEVQ